MKFKKGDKVLYHVGRGWGRAVVTDVREVNDRSLFVLKTDGGGVTLRYDNELKPDRRES